MKSEMPFFKMTSRSFFALLKNHYRLNSKLRSSLWGKKGKADLNQKREVI